MKRALILITIIMAALLLLSSCGEKKTCPADCGDGNPCTSDSCSKETGYQCRNTPIPGCSLECGTPCMGAAGAYMDMQCDPSTKQCASDVKQGLKISTSSLTNEMLSMGNKFKVVTTFLQPFNMAKDLFNIRISTSQFGTGISDIKVTKIELTGLDANRQTVTLGEKSVNKYVWSTETTLEEDIRVDFPFSENDAQYSNFKARVSYDYKQTYANQATDKKGVFEITLRGVNFAVFKPTMTYSCPASCDDGNEGTSDTCDATTDFFCEHNPIPGKCGNFICEPNENKCTCEADCGPCSGSAGTYLTFLCSDQACKTMMNPGTIQEPISISDDRNMNFFYFQNTYSYKSPFNVNADSFTANFELYNKQSAVGAVRVKEAKILDLNQEIASAPIEKTLNAIGDTASVSIPVTAFALHEDQKSLSIKVYIEYDYTTPSGTELRKADYTKPLGQLTLINPTLS